MKVWGYCFEPLECFCIFLGRSSDIESTPKVDGHCSGVPPHLANLGGAF